MKVSLLILVHNAEPYIGRCMRSLFAQTYGDIEYVFVDDASPDRSIEVLRGVLAEFPERQPAVKIIANPRNLGIAESRNVALDSATGDYVLFIDSDDYLAPRAVELLADKAVADGADIVVYDSYTVRDGVERVRNELFPETKEEYIRAMLFRQVRVAMWAKMVRRGLFTDHGLRFVPGMNYGEDFYLSPMLVYHANRVVKLARPLYYYVRHSASISYSLSPAKADNVVQAAGLLSEFFTRVPDAVQYAPMLDCMKVINKVAILQAGNMETWKYADGLYGDTDSRKCPLRASQRLILWLHEHHIRWAMRAYRRAAELLGRE